MAGMKVVALHVLRAVLHARGVLHQAVDIVPATPQQDTT